MICPALTGGAGPRCTRANTSFRLNRAMLGVAWRCSLAAAPGLAYCAKHDPAHTFTATLQNRGGPVASKTVSKYR